jgi:hypothetical protein
MRAFVVSAAVLLCVCAPSSAGGAPPASASLEPCPSRTVNFGGYLYGGALGVQEGILKSLDVGGAPLKIVWANRGAVPPREMTILARNLNGLTPAVSLTAAWAATSAQPTFPAQGPVVGYVSIVPTLATAGCWTFRWDGGDSVDAITLHVPLLVAPNRPPGG